jgi:hypothetical protein
VTFDGAGDSVGDGAAVCFIEVALGEVAMVDCFAVCARVLAMFIVVWSVAVNDPLGCDPRIYSRATRASFPYQGVVYRRLQRV